ncbi:hypothetical protein [Actinophytocola algeriensis]|uniref:Uncharacterized protein n=1 Tax=Actinophytocola algeriensis TaxID=1768010 RepID=A0A7W7Q4T6_9PSEU|nr:hypothetical protein [Actinophytocola algeriensis]MBB4907085.1 hypothetical protein [Actinophytocola algeriensis]MBE1478568.1 hypothetical protein [Actinophytocola algeriensis]
MSTLAATGIPDAATQDHSIAGLVSVVVVALAIVTAGYFVRCWLFPFTSCRHSDARRLWRCRRCDGTGRRLRVGRRLINHLRAMRRH